MKPPFPLKGRWRSPGTAVPASGSQTMSNQSFTLSSGRLRSRSTMFVARVNAGAMHAGGDMRRLLFLIAVAGLGPRPVSAQSDVISFYSLASAQSLNPPAIDSLVILCRKQLEYQGETGWVTIAGRRGGQALLFINGKIKNLSEAIALVPARPTLPPTARPGPKGTLDWGYVWDRNGDGRVDYIVYLDNATFVLPDSVPSDFPLLVHTPSALGGPKAIDYFGWPERPIPADSAERAKNFPAVWGGVTGSMAVDRDAIPILERSVQMVFFHYADDNFDGRPEAVVVPERDVQRPIFVGRRTVFRSTGGGGAVNDAWSFRRAITDTLSLPKLVDGGYVWWPMFSANPMPARQPFEVGGMLLTIVNLAVKECGADVHLRRE